uniref:C2H2-type domain-containing protein n=1 Tax=viral metagenome TaxID=1070528 RepID=A0A6C0F0D9_9ZZZZ
MKKNAENAEEFFCKECDFRCCKMSNWTTHKLTRKHQNRTNLNEKMPKNATANFSCKKCNKAYKARNSLWYHESKCNVTDVDRLLTDNQRLLSDNVELRNFIIEQSKLTAELVNKALESSKNTNIVNSNNNTINNNKFNINLFLNEQCKDAFNFTEFVKNIEISYQDLENNAQLGFVQGISKIFMDNLKQLSINERPIHCTDVKRETMYIKDEDKWTKEVDDSKLQKAIQTVSYKSMGKLMEWKQENPEYQDADSEFSKRCIDIQRQSLAGSERNIYYPKVIHVLAKETMVDK